MTDTFSLIGIVAAVTAASTFLSVLTITCFGNFYYRFTKIHDKLAESTTSTHGNQQTIANAISQLIQSQNNTKTLVELLVNYFNKLELERQGENRMQVSAQQIQQQQQKNQQKNPSKAVTKPETPTKNNVDPPSSKDVQAVIDKYTNPQDKKDQ